MTRNYYELFIYNNNKHSLLFSSRALYPTNSPMLHDLRQVLELGFHDTFSRCCKNRWIIAIQSYGSHLDSPVGCTLSLLCSVTFCWSCRTTKQPRVGQAFGLGLVLVGCFLVFGKYGVAGVYSLPAQGLIFSSSSWSCPPPSWLWVLPLCLLGLGLNN
jgi:hypothetical protein